MSSLTKFLKALLAFLPIKIYFKSFPCVLIFSDKFFVNLIIELLKPPHNPLSAEQTINSTFFWEPVPFIKGVPVSLLIDFSYRDLIIFCILWEYGLAETAFSCAFLSFAAATIFIADVIFFVDLTLEILLLRSFKLGMRFTF